MSLQGNKTVNETGCPAYLQVTNWRDWFFVQGHPVRDTIKGWSAVGTWLHVWEGTWVNLWDTNTLAYYSQPCFSTGFPVFSETCQPGRGKWRVPRNHIPHLTHKWPLGLWCPGTLCWNCLCPSIGFPWHMLRMKGPHVHSRDYMDRLPFMVTIGWRFKGLKAPVMTLDQVWKWDGLGMIRNAQACMRSAGFSGR